MDEFTKVTPSLKKIIEYLHDLKPFEHVSIKASDTGEVDTFLIIRQTKVLVRQGSIKYIK